MSAGQPSVDDVDSLLAQSRSAAWEARSDATLGLRSHVADPRVCERRIEMLGDPEDISVIEAAATALVLGDGERGLERFAAVFDSLDEQAGSYAAVAVSDALGDTVFVRLLELITMTDDARVRDGARHLGEDIGMRASPQWHHVFPD